MRMSAPKFANSHAIPKFANGQMLDVKRPLRLLEATSSKTSDPLDKDKLKIDSDKALETAMSEQEFHDLLAFLQSLK